MLMSVVARSRLSAVMTTTTRAGAVRFFSDKDDVGFKDPSHYTLTGTAAPYKLGKHRSNALELIQQHPIIEVDGDMAVCDGGGGPLGHPLEYIALHRPGEVQACIYCGLRYKQKGT